MASYHLSASIIGRSEGRSAIAAAAYRSGTTMTDPATGKTHDYRRKGGVVSTEIMLPENAPSWAADRQSLWQAVEAKEARVNSRLSREIRLALPDELNEAERATLVRSWVRQNITSQGIAADIAIHAPSAEGDQRNHHAHIMTTLRRFDLERTDGWAKGAARDLNEVGFLEGLRSSWADAQNAALARAGSTASVDHRSLEAQKAAAEAEGDHLLALALDRDPEPRLGVAAAAIDRAAGKPITANGIAIAESREIRAGIMAALERARRAGRVMQKIQDAAIEKVQGLWAALSITQPQKGAPAPPDAPELAADDDGTPSPA